MTEEVQQNETNNGTRWRFWFLVSTSLLLIVTFIFYLPTRFERNFLRGEGHEAMEEMAEMEMMRGNGHAEQTLFREEEDIREGLTVNLSLSSTPVFVNNAVQLDFFVNEKPGNIPVSFEELDLEHTKLMHVIGVRSDLNEFFHIHPEARQRLDIPQPFYKEKIEALEQPTTSEELSPVLEPTQFPLIPLTPEEREELIRRTEIEGPTTGVLSATHIFTKPGLYKLWSEVKKEGVEHAFGHPIINVEGEGEKENKQISFGRNAMIGGYQVFLELEEPVLKGHEHDLSFDIHTLTGGEVEVEDFLGAPMHLAVIKDDLAQFIHTHPETGDNAHGGLQLIGEAKAHGGEVDGHEATGEDETINFRVAFPEAGFYKVFAQFRPQGIGLPPDEALTASFWIEVYEKAGFNSTAVRWVLFITSFIAIIILSIFVNKFIRIKA